MDIDAGSGMGHLGNDARDDRHAEVVQLVRDAVVRHGEQRGVTENGFPGAGRGGIALIAACVGRQQPADVGERCMNSMALRMDTSSQLMQSVA